MKQASLHKILLLILLLVLSAGSALLLGSVQLSPAELFSAFTDLGSDSIPSLLVWTVRLPRVLGCILAGMGLASAGVILQQVMNNALASPNTIGVNAGAGFGAMVAMVVLPANMAAISAGAFLGAFFTSLMVFALAWFADRSRITIVLAGITISSFFSACINSLKLLNSDLSIDLNSFLIGSLSGLTMGRLLLPGIGILTALLLSLLLTQHLNLLGLGDDVARGLGLRVSAVRLGLLMLASLLAGCVVSYTGLLSFVGLIVPHICRKLFGSDARVLLPCSALLGASFVTLCDLMGRVLFAPYELPAGILMAFVGGPFFLYLLLGRKGGRRLHA